MEYWKQCNPKYFFYFLILNTNFYQICLATTAAPNNILIDKKILLDSLDASIFALKINILSFSGIISQLNDFIDRIAILQSAIDQLRQKIQLPEADLIKISDQIASIESVFWKLNNDFYAAQGLEHSFLKFQSKQFVLVFTFHIL